jgi:hypothetical protein
MLDRAAFAACYANFIKTSPRRCDRSSVSSPKVQGSLKELEKSMIRMRSRLLTVGVCVIAAATVPLAAQASEVVTFDWVSITENPASVQTVTPSGTLQLTLPTFALTGTSTPPNYGPYYASGAASTANITGFSYTDAEGLTVGLSNLTSKSVSSTTWVTSGTDTPATGAQAVSPPSAGYYLVSGFSLSGTSTQGSNFMIANSAGTAGATYANGIGNGDNTFQATSSLHAVTDGGYWELVSVSSTPVPLPAALPLLLGGMGLLSRFGRRRVSPGAGIPA